jgi:hypothetical protein
VVLCGERAPPEADRAGRADIRESGEPMLTPRQIALSECFALMLIVMALVVVVLG